MEPSTKRRTTQSDSAVRWWGSLSAHQVAPTPPTRSVAVTLGLAALAAAVSQPLVWHHLIVPNPAFIGPPALEVFTGVAADSWLIAVALIAAGCAVHTYRRALSFAMRVALTLLALATTNGIFIDYFDWNTRGVSPDAPAFYGPGFFVGLGCPVLLVAAAVIGWRARD